MGSKVLVLGGGVSGLSVAWALSEKGVEVELIEAGSPEIGGLAATVKKEGYLLDYGPHFFLSERSDVVKRITSLFKEEMPMVRRDAKLYFHGKYLNYPLTVKNVLLELSIFDSAMIASSYFMRKFTNSIKKFFKKESDVNFELWAKNAFGNYLYKLFFRPYTEQFWKINCRELSPDSIPTNTQLSFFSTLKLLFKRNIVKKNMSLVERETTLPLRYPKWGVGMIPEAIADTAKKHGAKIETGFKVEKIKKEKNGKFAVTAVKKGKQKKFSGDMVISTIPLTEAMKILEPAPPQEVLESSKKLNFLSLIVLYIVTPNKEILSSQYLYLLGTPFNRIAEINKFSKHLCPEDENMLAVEVSCHRDGELWKKSDEEIFEMCITNLEKRKILSRKDAKKYFVLRAPYAYPIYFKDYKVHLNNLFDYADSIGSFKLLGRSGRYLYMDMDYCIIRAFDLAEEVLKEIKNGNGIKD